MLTNEQVGRVKTLIEALESGEYKKGKHCLRNERNEFCCLGVACDLSGLGEWGAPEGGEHNYQQQGIDENPTPESWFNSCVLPEVVREYYGLPHRFGFLVAEKFQASGLTNLNDSTATFAEVIEELKRWLEENRGK